MKKLLILSAIILLAGCCCTKSRLQGSWLQPVPGQEGVAQGIKLDKGGVASSINMYTLVYDKWSIKGDTLTLSGQSLGSGQTTDFTEDYKIKILDGDSLVLDQNGTEIAYTRAN